MKRPLVVYFACFATTVALFALYVSLAPGPADQSWALPLWRMLLFGGGVAAAVATWGAAIWVATLHHTIWPFLIAVVSFCGAMMLIVVRHSLAG